MIDAIRIKWFATYAVVSFLAFAPDALHPATARGWCNIDRLGTTQLQREVAAAGAAFFGSGSSLMEMFGLIERGDDYKAKDTGSVAVESFGRAKALYQTVAEKMGEISDDKLMLVNVNVAAGIAETSQTVPLFSEIAKTAQGPKAPANLIILCSVEADRMKAAVATFLGTQRDQERYFATLLSAWGRALYVGRTVSAFFAAAGGER
jgi:hypothetical protein